MLCKHKDLNLLKHNNTLPYIGKWVQIFLFSCLTFSIPSTFIHCAFCSLSLEAQRHHLAIKLPVELVQLSSDSVKGTKKL